MLRIRVHNDTDKVPYYLLSKVIVRRNRSQAHAQAVPRLGPLARFKPFRVRKVSLPCTYDGEA